MKYIGVRTSTHNIDLRRELLLFDQIAMPFLEETVKVWSDDIFTDDHKQIAADLAWLAEKEIIVVPSVNVQHQSAVADYKKYLQFMELFHQQLDDVKKVYDKDTVCTIIEELRNKPQYSHLSPEVMEAMAVVANYVSKTGDSEIMARINKISDQDHIYLSRALAIELASRDAAIIALPVVSRNMDDQPALPLTRTEVLNIVLGSIPFPASGTPLEELIDFRSDPDVRDDFLALHRWASTIGQRVNSPNEMREQVDHLVSQYQRHMRRHKIKEEAGLVETVVTVTAEVLENLVKVKWAALARLPFSFKKKAASLLEAEMTAPGREVAYLAKTINKFGAPSN